MIQHHANWWQVPVGTGWKAQVMDIPTTPPADPGRMLDATGALRSERTPFLVSGLPPDGRVRLRLIGQMTANDATGPVALPRVRKTRALLAILAMADGRPVLREHVTSLLWSTRERQQARASLRQCVHELQEFGASLGLVFLRSERQHLQLDADLVWVDVLALGRATSAQAEGPAGAHTGALDLLQGALLEDLVGLDPAFDQWIANQTRQMREGAAVLAGLVLEQQTEPGAVISAARRVVALAPLHEAGWRRLISAYAASGEQAAATEAYEQCVRALARAGGAQPSGETTALMAGLRSPQPQAIATVGGHMLRRTLDSSGQARGVWLGVGVFRPGDPMDGAAICVGLADEITSALARFRWINLIAPGSIAALAHEPTGMTERWRGLDLDFLLDGTVQRSRAGAGGEQIRVTVRLLDMRAGGEIVWSGRFDRTAADLFTLQDEIAAETAAQVDPELMLHESRRATARPMRDASAYELMLRAIPAIYRLAEPGYSDAGILLARAAERAPDNASIFAWWACWYAFLVGQGWAPDPAAAMQRAGELAEQAVTLDPACARALSIAGYVRSFVLHQEIGETIGLHERALALNPHLPFAWAASALSLSYAGDHVTAVARGMRAHLLSPFDPHSFFFDSALMVPHLMLHDFEAVVRLGRRSLALNPAMSATWKGLLSALGHLGRTAEAADVRATLLRIEPNFNLADAAARSPLRRVEDLHLYLEGLRRAGLAEHRQGPRIDRAVG